MQSAPAPIPGILLHSVRTMPAPTISIWRLSPQTLQSIAELPPHALTALRHRFSAEELRRAAAFHHEADRILYTAAHAALRAVLSRLSETPPTQLQITAEGGAKPTLRHSNPQIYFNLAHTRSAALIATSTACEVGIDIEKHRPLDDLESLAATIMSPAERATWTTLPQTSRPPAFYRLWTRKEAYLKAIGLGLFRELQSITVPLTPADHPTPVLVEDRGEPLPHPYWLLHDLPTWPGFSAALCWQADTPSIPSPRIEIHDLTISDL